jgi:hypothetical protein
VIPDPRAGAVPVPAALRQPVGAATAAAGVERAAHYRLLWGVSS